MPSRRRAATLEDRLGSLRAMLLLAVALLASAALQRLASADGARSIAAHRSHEPYVPVLRASAPMLTRAHFDPVDGSNGARGAQPLAASASVWTLGAPIVVAASIGDRTRAAVTRRGALPCSRAPPVI